MTKQRLFKATFPRGQVQRWAKEAQRDNDTAITRALNTTSNFGIKQSVREVSEISGATQSKVKSLIKVVRATLRKRFFEWEITGKRLPVIRRAGKVKSKLIVSKAIALRIGYFKVAAGVARVYFI